MDAGCASAEVSSANSGRVAGGGTGLLVRLWVCGRRLPCCRKCSKRVIAGSGDLPSAGGTHTAFAD